MLDEEEDLPKWVGDVGRPVSYVILVVLIGLIFWGLAVVCEERFVPSLSVICERCAIPEDVAGATLMAAGASSPEVFASMVALFVTHTSLGIGTVVGSEIFNHLMICAGSAFYAKGGVLTLDRRVVARESAFYGLALVLLLVAVTAERTTDERVVVRWDDAVVMLCVYASYVLVCANFESLVGPSSSIQKEQHVARLVREPSQNFKDQGRPELLYFEEGGGGEGGAAESAILHHPHHASASVSSSSSSSLMGSWFSLAGDHGDGVSSGGSGVNSGGGGEVTNPRRYATLGSSSRSSSSSLRTLESLREYRHTDSLRRLSSAAARLVHKLDLFGAHRDLDDVSDSISSAFGCYMFRNNRYYAMARISAKAWDLRWCVLRFDRRELRTYKRRDDVDRVPFWTKSHGARRYAVRKIRVVDADRGIVELQLTTKTDPHPDDEDEEAGGPQERWTDHGLPHVAVLLAPCPQVFESFVRKARAVVEATTLAEDEEEDVGMEGLQARGAREDDGASLLCSEQKTAPLKAPRVVEESTLPSSTLPSREEGPLEGSDDGGEASSLVAWPEAGASLAERAAHVGLWPFKAALHVTIRDVRSLEKPSGRDAAVASAQCVCWLAGLSFFMCSLCETLGDLLGLSDAVIGITFSAVGTSLPNLFASMTAARQGWGNMACSNALGSNTFNILVALGLPWLLECLFVGPYEDLPAEHVVAPIVVLLVVLLAFLVLLGFTNFTLNRIHASAFVLLYVLFLYWVLTL